MSGAPGSTPEHTPERDAELAAFLRAAGWPRQAARPLAGDASNRRYLRLADAGRGGAVLMDAPPERGEDVRRFVAVTHWLRQHGFSAPAIAAADTARGFLLLEDSNLTGSESAGVRSEAAGIQPCVRMASSARVYVRSPVLATPVLPRKDLATDPASLGSRPMPRPVT